MDKTLKKKPEETELAYLWRLGQLKDSCVVDMTWSQLADILNAELRDPDDAWTEQAYRKKYAVIKAANDQIFSALSPAEDEEQRLKLLRDDIYKAKRQLSDQRREYNAVLTSDARADHLTEHLLKAVHNLNVNYPLMDYSTFVDSNPEKEAIACFADWHYGMVANNVWNRYDTEECCSRVATCVGYMKKYLRQNHISMLRVALLGDMVEGAIHVTSRVRSEENVCDQIINVSELIADAINELSSVVNEVHVYACTGNHARTVQNKKDSVYADNMEKLIPWWLRERLRENHKVTVHESHFDEFTFINVFDYNVCAVHGDTMSFREIGGTVNTLSTKLFGAPIDYTISGHAHHLEEFEQFNIESILVRSLCGTDDFAAEKHLFGEAGQTLIIFNKEYGRECTYHIPL